MAASSYKIVSVVCVVLAVFSLASHHAHVEAGITCGQVSSSLAQCIPYLRGTVPTQPAACCNGIKSLNNAAKTTPDRQTACNCLKSAAANIQGFNPKLAEGLPGKCGVSVPYKIAPSTDCSQRGKKNREEMTIKRRRGKKSREERLLKKGWDV
ncbi:lipid-transfer protein [Asimina triloba]